MVTIAPLRPGDRAGWEDLARGYKAFYRDPIPDEEYDRAWGRLMDGDGIHALGARREPSTPLLGIAHFLFHTTVWQGQACYLQDLFTAEEARGKGVARALIGAVAEAARRQGARRYYWLTAEDNVTARALYDKVARFKGFVRYDYQL